MESVWEGVWELSGYLDVLSFSQTYAGSYLILSWTDKTVVNQTGDDLMVF